MLIIYQCNIRLLASATISPWGLGTVGFSTSGPLLPTPAIIYKTQQLSASWGWESESEKKYLGHGRSQRAQYAARGGYRDKSNARYFELIGSGTSLGKTLPATMDSRTDRFSHIVPSLFAHFAVNMDSSVAEAFLQRRLIIDVSYLQSMCDNASDYD